MKNRIESLYKRMKPFIAVIFMQLGFAWMDIHSKAELNRGHAVATLVNVAPFAMTRSIFMKIMVLNLNLNILYFLYICICTHTHKVKITTLHSRPKIAGTIATVAEAMVMTLMRGPPVDLLYHAHENAAGATYPTESSLTVLVMERGKPVYSVRIDYKLFWVFFFFPFNISKIHIHKNNNYVQGVIMQDRGPVSVMAFSPLCMVIVAVMSSIILVEKMYLAVAGLYLVVWRKSKDYNSSPTVDDQMILTKQTTDPGNHEKENFDQQVAQPIQQI
ncbi:hypothetical protein P3X46_005747 [Hevea brasiliensis]|uniref:WAT1-related protein n=1 Tax=Hevea brasiliensis TaxID=3981 RepID=A0ABQ9N4S5_HEVBR|nr:hypothetical protein P3X46_005747 [Hevea brasiliensis]